MKYSRGPRPSSNVNPPPALRCAGPSSRVGACAGRVPVSVQKPTSVRLVSRYALWSTRSGPPSGDIRVAASASAAKSGRPPPQIGVASGGEGCEPPHAAQRRLPVSTRANATVETRLVVAASITGRRQGYSSEHSFQAPPTKSIRASTLLQIVAAIDPGCPVLYA